MLQPSLETQNQIKVIHLNYICDWTVEARTLNIRSEVLFLIATKDIGTKVYMFAS